MGKLADALSEKSKFDNKLVVGSEIRAALQELEQEKQAIRAGVQRALDTYFAREMLEQPVTDDEMLEHIIEILESVVDVPGEDTDCKHTSLLGDGRGPNTCLQCGATVPLDA